MGLDQYAYIAGRRGQRAEFWESAVPNKDENGNLRYRNPKVAEPVEIAYWRKHPNLQGWMEQLWHEKMQGWDDPDYRDDAGIDFNNVELELTRDDIDRLEDDIINSRLPATQGFFFGGNSDDHYREQDLEFCRRARAELFMGLKVFYNSSW